METSSRCGGGERGLMMEETVFTCIRMEIGLAWGLVRLGCLFSVVAPQRPTLAVTT
jgi:hypothetical protein